MGIRALLFPTNYKRFTSKKGQLYYITVNESISQNHSKTRQETLPVLQIS
jgi:hypothetical protein